MTALSLCAIFTSYGASASAHQSNELMRQWIELESQKGKLQSHWERQKSRLETKKQLLIEQEKQLIVLLKEAKTNKSQVDEARLTLVNQQIEFEKQDEVIKKTISEAYVYLSSLVQQLPPPVQNEWAGKLSLLNDQAASNNEKLERYVSLLQSAYKFNQRIVHHEGPLAIPSNSGEQLVNVHQIYLGLNQAWYVSEDKTHFGFGKAIDGVWHWFNGADAEHYLNQKIDTASLIDIKNTLKNPTAASYISAPISVNNNKGVL